MRVRYSLTSAIALFTVGILVSSSCAKIDREAVAGIWLFDEGEGMTVSDSSKNSNDGEIIGAKWVDGNFGKALQFNGGSAFVQIEHSDELSLETFTVAAWVKIEVEGQWQYILCKTPRPAPPWKRNYSIQTFIVGDVLLGGFDDKAKVDGPGDPWEGVIGRTKIADKQWHHVAVTYDKKVLKAYVDGILESQRDLTLDPITNTAPIMIGTNVINQGVNGIIDEVGLFNVALSEEDINAIMNEGLETAANIAAVCSAGMLATTWGLIRDME